MPDMIRIGVLEDDPNMRGYLSAVLQQSDETELMFCVDTLADALNQDVFALDLCLIDLQLPDGDGTEFVTHLARTSRAKALILTVLADKVSVVAGIRSGAHGYLLKDSEPHQILQRIRQTLLGDTPVSNRAITHLVEALRTPPGETPPEQNTPSPLSGREEEILTLFAKGMSYRETSEALDISSHTVGAHAKSIYGKLGVNSRNEAIFEALKLGWIAL